jgi:hypothetical protein
MERVLATICNARATLAAPRATIVWPESEADVQDDSVSKPGVPDSSQDVRPPFGPTPHAPDEVTRVRPRELPLIAEPAVPPPPDYSRE